MRYLFRKTFRSPALRATRWSALLVTLLYLLAGNLHTCELSSGYCCPQEAVAAQSGHAAKTSTQGAPSQVTSTTANVPPCCRHLLGQPASASPSPNAQVTATVSYAQVAPGESCPSCRFCLAKLLQHTPAQAVATFVLHLRSTRVVVLSVRALTTTAVGATHQFKNRGPPFVV